jgi:hypothetical protein
MSVIGEFTVPASALAMHRTLTASRGTTVEIERVVAHQRGTLTPNVWIRGGDREQFETAIDEAPSLVGDAPRRLRGRDALPGGVAPGRRVRRTGLPRDGRDHPRGDGPGRMWELRLRFDDHQEVSTVNEYWGSTASRSR